MILIFLLADFKTKLTCIPKNLQDPSTLIDRSIMREVDNQKLIVNKSEK